MTSQTILLYILKSIFISGLFLGYYWIVLRNKSLNNYNRFYLLLSIISSLVIPLLNFNWFTIPQQELPVTNVDFLFTLKQAHTQPASSFTWLTLAGCAVVGVSIALVAMFIANIIKVYRLKKKSAVLKIEGVDFIYTDLDNAPFSFLKNLFWKESISMDSTYGKKIFKHELTHITQKHTLDILFCQVVNGIFWMNPFNWLIQKELRNIHEFIADKEAVGDNNVEDFARLLLQAHYGNHFLSPTHSFYYSSIKRRLLMLTTNKTRFSHARRLLVLPVALLAVASLSVSTIESKATPVIESIIVSDAPVVAPTVLSRVNAALKNDTTPKRVTVEIKKAVSKDKPVEKAEEIKEVVIHDVTFEAASKTEEKTAPTFIFRANKAISSDSAKVKVAAPIFYIDGRLASMDDVNKLDPKNIKSINVWKSESALQKFGVTNSDGVIEVWTKDPPITIKLAPITKD